MLREGGDWPGPPLLKKEVCSASDSEPNLSPRGRTELYTRKRTLSNHSHDKKTTMQICNGFTSEGVAQELELTYNNACKSGGELSKDCEEGRAVNGDLEMPCLQLMVNVSSKGKERRFRKNNVSNHKITNGLTEPDSSTETGSASELPSADFTCESLDQISMLCEDYDSSSSTESDAAFLKKAFVSNRPLVSPDLDSQLYEFVLSRSIEGSEVSNQVLKQKSQEIAVSLGFKNFVSSNRFIDLWKKRMNIVCNSDKSEPKMGHFATTYSILKSKHTYDDEDVGSLYIAHLTGHIDNTKRVCSIILSVLASGKKLPAFVLFDKVNGVKPKVPSNVKVTVSSGSLVTLDVHKDWAKQMWGVQENKNGRRLVVLFDKTLCSVVEWCMVDYATDVVQAPSSLIPTWAKDFEVQLSRRYNKFMVGKGSYQLPAQQELLDWISDSWQNVNKEDIFLLHQAFNAIGRTDNTKYFYETDHTYDICHASEKCFVEVYSESSDEAI